MNSKSIPSMTLRRLPVYLHYLKSVRKTRKNISSSLIACEFGLNDVQVRKDLGAVSGSGRPKTGYNVEKLISQIENCLGIGCETKTILVGAGNLGKALLSYEGFLDFGVNIIAAFDTDKELVGEVINGKTIFPLSELDTVCFEEKVMMGIITTPLESAQDICDRLVSCGIKAIWNFAPTILKVDSGVFVENENFASSLAILSKHLRGKKTEDEV